MIQQKNIRIIDEVADWKEAISQAVMPLIENGYVETRYVDSIIENTEKFGPYYVIAPNIALPHARPEQGVLKKQLGILLLRHPIKFSQDGFDVRLLITLAASDSESHLQTLSKLSDILGDDDRIGKILGASSVEEIYRLFTLGY
ncbi:MAG: PTS sugar transporter subunit IIA [Erysipelotrichaceae bacterium]|nr:PTS sugar transporter subunit IIA [Erysipelotrichaceae bacterium]